MPQANVVAVRKDVVCVSHVVLQDTETHMHMEGYMHMGEYMYMPYEGILYAIWGAICHMTHTCGTIQIESLYMYDVVKLYMTVYLV